MRRQPWWRRVKRYVTLRLFGYVNARDFGMAVTNENNVEELQAAMDYCSDVHLKPGTYNMGHPVVLDKQNQTITGQVENGSVVDPNQWIFGTRT